MANNGLTYFPHDTNSCNDVKIRILMGKIGFLGYGIYYSLLENIYYEKGYFLEMNNDIKDPDKFIKELFCSDRKIKELEFDEVLLECINLKLFDKSRYEKYKILTSRRIQDTYFSTIVDARRLRCEVINELLIYDMDNLKYSKRTKQERKTFKSNEGNTIVNNTVFTFIDFKDIDKNNNNQDMNKTSLVKKEVEKKWKPIV